MLLKQGKAMDNNNSFAIIPFTTGTRGSTYNVRGLHTTFMFRFLATTWAFPTPKKPPMERKPLGGKHSYLVGKGGQISVPCHVLPPCG